LPVCSNINRDAAKDLVQQLSDAAVTLLQDNGLLQRINFAQRTAIVSIGPGAATPYQQELAKTYTNSTLFNLEKSASPTEVNKLLFDLKGYSQIIVGVHDTRLRPGSKLDFNNDVKNCIVQLAALPNTAISVFANPYTLAAMPGIEKSGILLACYQKDEGMQKSAAKVISRQLTPMGKLPVTVNTFFVNGSGIVNTNSAL
jgi:beta-N-acetylhexosaminidase